MNIIYLLTYKGFYVLDIFGDKSTCRSRTHSLPGLKASKSASILSSEGLHF